MKSNSETSRRGFLSTGVTTSAGIAAGIGAGQAMAGGFHASGAGFSKANRLPREVWIATISQEDQSASDAKDMSKQMLDRMTLAMALQPDVICLPEAFPFVRNKRRQAVSDVAESGVGEILKPFSDFAKQHGCYLVCPVYTRHNDKDYNAAVFLDRQGKVAGEYKKTHTTTGEMDAGVCPGPSTPQVVQADFGKVGAQICFDIEWDDGWRKLRNAGAEIVFWPSAFGGGKMVNTRAWQNRYCVVTSTQKGTSKICDVDGEELAATSLWHRWVCAPVNLEKAFLHTWPYVQRFGDIIAKYGNSVRIKTYEEEEWSIIESRDPSVKIADLMNEFELMTIEQHLQAAEQQQDRSRPS